jgi:type IV fimbrial biogenesis protein FimT
MNPSFHVSPVPTLTSARRASRGFTLLEIMLVVSIAGLILGFGVPAFGQYIRNAAMTSGANDLLSGMFVARSEAVKRRQQTVVCMAAEPEGDAADCDGDGTTGWIAFVDADADGTVDDGEPVLVRQPGREGVTLSIMPADSGNYFAYAPSGFGVGIAAAGDPMTAVVMCDDRGNVPTDGGDLSAARALELSATGRPRTTRSVAEIDSDAMGGCP